MPWICAPRTNSRTTVLLEVRRPVDGAAIIELDRTGRPRHAYQVSTHDVDARITGNLPGPLL
ncbi:hypothetical protein [Nocardia sp. CA-120079]|uniref:hypothetical protein n=1 Tax=Nocardia sp. CA-120079 TaxID=3239974 RepID=UPI003D99B51C